jgi:hypothetical protein
MGPDDLAAVSAKDGAYAAAAKAKEQKMARFIGITCHAYPDVLATALERHEFDCTQMALNAAQRGQVKDASPCFETVALPVALRKKMGVTAMKIFAQDALVGQAAAQKLIHYSMSLPVAATVIGMPKVTASAAAPNAALPKPKAAGKPQPQKNYALLSDIQIAGIKERLKLSSAQESYWPPVETALRAVARKIHAKRQVDPNAAGVPIDPEAEEVQQLKSAAMPLLFQLREDQKNEVRSLARIIGLEKVAAMI